MLCLPCEGYRISRFKLCSGFQVPVDYSGFYIALALYNSIKVAPNAQDDLSEFWRMASESTTQIKDMIKQKKNLATWWAFKDQGPSVKQVSIEESRREHCSYVFRM